MINGDPRGRFHNDTPHNRENKLYQLAAAGYISSPSMFRDYLKEVNGLPYQSRLNLIKRVRAGISDAAAEMLEREVFAPCGWNQR